MNYRMPERPTPSDTHKKFRVFVGAFVCFSLVFFIMKAGDAIAPYEDSFLNRLFDVIAIVYGVGLGCTCGYAMRRLHDDKCRAWDEYWVAFYQRMADLEKNVAEEENPRFREEYERELAQAKKFYEENF